MEAFVPQLSSLGCETKKTLTNSQVHQQAELILASLSWLDGHLRNQNTSTHSSSSVTELPDGGWLQPT